MNIPADPDFPADAVQCDRCGGHGCPACAGRGWLPWGHPGGRRCARAGCGRALPPERVAVYCSPACAWADA